MRFQGMPWNRSRRLRTRTPGSTGFPAGKDAGGLGAALLLALLATEAPAQSAFRRGDTNADGVIDISDPIAHVSCLFLGESCAGCADAADANDDGRGDLADPIYIFDYLYRGGPPPAAPFGDCGQDPTDDALGCAAHAACVAAGPRIRVDPSVEPAVEAIHGYDGRTRRPLASLVDASGSATDFVADELSLATADKRELQAFLERWDGEVIATVDPAAFGLDKPAERLVRVDTSAVDPDRLGADLRALAGGDEEPGDHRVSSEEGLRLLAVAAKEAVRGLDVAVNWVARPQHRQFADGESVEGAGGPAIGSTSYRRDVYDWPSHNAGSTQDIGVTEAWRMLERNGRLEPGSVPIAILDAGFQPDDDLIHHHFLLGHWIATSPLPVDPVGTTNLGDCGTPCPYHGTNVTSAAMAVPDNEFGSAGPAGPVAEPYLIFTTYDRFSVLLSFLEVLYNEAKIVNMSFSAYRPKAYAWLQKLTKDFDDYTRALRARDILVVASAGNQGENVGDRRFYWPCENEDVVCVGGLAWDSKLRAGNSNHGGPVDIFAPYTMWVGPDPATPSVHRVNGTSFSSPYVAGVAGLVWAANPDLSADEVEDVLLATAHTSPDSQVDRYVNARAAVREALISSGIEPLSIRIEAPSDGSTYAVGSERVSFSADAWDVEEGVPEIVWRSDVDGEIGRGRTFTRVFRTPGVRTVAATAIDSDGNRVSDSVTIEVVNDPPRVSILSPEDGSVFPRSASIDLQAESFDPNAIGAVDDDRVTWFLDGDLSEPVARGHARGVVPGGSLSLGTHRITVRVTDEHGSSATESVTVTIEEDPEDNIRPTAVITSPADGSRFLVEKFDERTGLWYARVTLCGHGEDPEDGELHDESEVIWYGRPEGEGVFQILGEGTGEGTCPIVRLYLQEGSSMTYEVELQVTDSEGATGSRRIRLTVYTLI